MAQQPVLFGRCYTGQCLINSKQVTVFGLQKYPLEPKDRKVFKRTADTFKAKNQVTIEGVMMSCLSASRGFSMTLGLLSDKCQLSYGIVFGEDMMWQLNIATSVRDHTISWCDTNTMMVPAQNIPSSTDSLSSLRSPSSSYTNSSVSSQSTISSCSSESS